MPEGGSSSAAHCSSWVHSPAPRLRTLLLLILAPLAHPALLATPSHCRLSSLVPWRGAAAGSGVVRRARRSLRACAEPPESAEPPPDPDLVSAWLDDEKASVLTDGSVPEVEPSEAERLMSSGAVVLVDLRTPWQFAREFVPGAVNVPAGEPGPMGLTFHFREDFADAMAAAAPPGATLLLVCEFGVVSMVAATRLAEHGYAGVSAVRGGFEAWRLEAQGSIEGAIDDAEEAPFPEWSGETGGLAMWPVQQADPLEDPPEAAADQGIGFGLDDLDLGAPPPPPLSALVAVAAGVPEPPRASDPLRPAPPRPLSSRGRIPEIRMPARRPAPPASPPPLPPPPHLASPSPLAPVSARRRRAEPRGGGAAGRARGAVR